MEPLTLEQQEYKQKTIEQLQQNISTLEQRLSHERRPAVIEDIRKQSEEIQAHINLLHHELESGIAVEPVADKLFQRAARATTRKRFYLAKKLIHRLETIEPFYPNLERMKDEIEEGRVSRRTQAIAHRSPTSESSSAASSSSMALVPVSTAQSGLTSTENVPPRRTTQAEEPVEEQIIDVEGKRGLSRLFEFHIVVSCLTVTTILCVMSGIGAATVVQWLIEGS